MSKQNEKIEILTVDTPHDGVYVLNKLERKNLLNTKML